MEFAILGPLRVGGPDGPIRAGVPKHRALLAMLLLAYREDGPSASRLIDALCDEIWAGRAEAGLREALGPEFDVALREGAALSADEAIALALSDGDA